MNCWQCASPIAAKSVFCKHCGTLQPPDRSLNHFERLGVPEQYTQNEREMVERHRQLQRQLHPDRFASANAVIRRLSIEHATAINDAIRVLKDPLRRAVYCLELKGINLNDERSGIKLDPLFLMKVIELREAITELQGDDSHVERSKLEREVASWYEDILTTLEEGLDRIELDETELMRLAQSTAQLKYLRRALTDLQAEEG